MSQLVKLVKMDIFVSLEKVDHLKIDPKTFHRRRAKPEAAHLVDAFFSPTSWCFSCDFQKNLFTALIWTQFAR